MVNRWTVFAVVILVGWLTVYVLALIAGLDFLARVAAGAAILTTCAAMFAAGAADFYRQACAENGDETK